jgi:AbrB family looped-hinge helix DNA binding protein
MYTDSIKITNKGQITIPKEVRNILNSDIIAFEIVEGKVMINPIKSVAGSLRNYSKDLGSFEEVRNLAGERIADDWQK